MHFKLRDDYITLQQLLKACDVISSGGEIKFFLEENNIYVNGERETRRGKKLRSGDIVTDDDQLRIEIE